MTKSRVLDWMCRAGWHDWQAVIDWDAYFQNGWPLQTTPVCARCRLFKRRLLKASDG